MVPLCNTAVAGRKASETILARTDSGANDRKVWFRQRILQEITSGSCISPASIALRDPPLARAFSLLQGNRTYLGTDDRVCYSWQTSGLSDAQPMCLSCNTQQYHCNLRLRQQVFAPLCFLKTLVQCSSVPIRCSCTQLKVIWGSKGKASPEGGSNQGLPDFTVKPVVHVLLAQASLAKQRDVTKVAALTFINDECLYSVVIMSTRDASITCQASVVSSVDTPDGLLL